MAKTFRPTTNLVELVNNPTITGVWNFRQTNLTFQDKVDTFQMYLSSLDHALMLQMDGKYTNTIVAGTVAAAFLENACGQYQRLHASPFAVALGLSDNDITEYGDIYSKWHLLRHNGFPPASLLMLRWTKEEYIGKITGRIDIGGIHSEAKSSDSSTISADSSVSNNVSSS